MAFHKNDEVNHLIKKTDMTGVSINNDGKPLLLHKDDEIQTATSLLPIEATSEISLSSTNVASSNHLHICRLCHCQGTNNEPLISSCNCLGTMQYLHQSCLQRLIKNTGIKSCELCKCEYIVHVETKLSKQQKLSTKACTICQLVCSVGCNLFVSLVVLWIIYVLIEKTREEVRAGQLQWPLWTKLIVVATVSFAGLVYLYFQCKMYIKRCIRWRHSRHDQENDENLSSSVKYVNKKYDDDCILTISDGSLLNTNRYICNLK